MGNKSNDIAINTRVLKDIRESSGYSVEEISKKAKITLDNIKNAEEGNFSLTIKQIEKLADIYHRPLVAFFTDEIPKPLQLPDYRINRDKKLTKEVYLAERKANYISKKLSEISNKKSMLPSFSDNLKADEMANDFRKKINLNIIKSEKPSDTLEKYKKILEDKLIISIIEYPLKADDVRAFSISANVAVIVLNEQDTANIKLFSLFHEVCHLLKKNSGICSIEIEEENQEIERFCDIFAAEILVPTDEIKKDIEKYGTEKITELTRIYAVSKQVIMLRLLKLNFININRYNEFKKGFSQDKLKPKKQFGRRKWEKVFFNRVGNLAIQEVGNAYRSGKISSSEVIDVLNIKTKYVEKFIEAS